MIDVASLGSIPFHRLNTPVAVATALFCGVTSLSIVDASVVDRFDAGKLVVLSFLAGSPVWFFSFMTCRLVVATLPIGWRSFSGSEVEWLDRQRLVRQAQMHLCLPAATDTSIATNVKQAVLELSAEQGPDFKDRLRSGVRSTALVVRGFRQRNTELAMAITSGLTVFLALMSVRFDAWGVNTGASTDLLIPAAAFTTLRTVGFFAIPVLALLILVRVRRRGQSRS